MKLPNIYCTIAWWHWLDIAKPKNIFRLILNLSTKLL